MNQAIFTRAQKLYLEAREIVKEEVQLKLKSSGHIVRLASVLAELYQIFEGKRPGETLVLVPSSRGYANFRECMMDLLRPLELGERMGFSYVSIGRHMSIRRGGRVAHGRRLASRAGHPGGQRRIVTVTKLSPCL